ncbi:MAG: urease accessory protein UreD [Bacteroidota bacterium]
MMTKHVSEIEFSKSQLATVLTKNYCIPPLKVINTTSHTHACFCFITNYGAGFVEGDAIVLHLTAHPDTHSIIATQGNTRVYKSQEHPCSQSIEGVVKKNAFHVFLNDPVVIHKDGSFFQKSKWTLDEGAILLLVDWFSAGRVQNHEVFNFVRYQTETKVLVDGHPVIWDRFHIDPLHEDVTSPGGFHAHTSYMNIFLIGRQHDPRVQLIEDHLNKIHRKYTSPGNLNGRAEMPVVGSFARQNKNACFSRYASHDVIYLHRVLADLVQILDHKILLGFNPLRNRYNTYCNQGS